MKPAKSPSAITPTVPSPSKKAASPSAKGNPGPAEALPMPHERDQAVNMTPDAKSPKVEQAGEDIKRGVKDTSSGPELDTAYKKLKR